MTTNKAISKRIRAIWRKHFVEAYTNIYNDKNKHNRRIKCTAYGWSSMASMTTEQAYEARDAAMAEMVEWIASHAVGRQVVLAYYHDKTYPGGWGVTVHF